MSTVRKVCAAALSTVFAGLSVAAPASACSIVAFDSGRLDRVTESSVGIFLATPVDHVDRWSERQIEFRVMEVYRGAVGETVVIKTRSPGSIPSGDSCGYLGPSLTEPVVVFAEDLGSDSVRGLTEPAEQPLRGDSTGPALQRELATRLGAGHAPDPSVRAQHITHWPPLDGAPWPIPILTVTALAIALASVLAFVFRAIRRHH